MKTIAADELTDLFIEFFEEAYEGRDKNTWFVDGGSDSGLFRTLRDVTAKEASGAPDGGATIASHVEHLRFALEMANQIIRGGPLQVDWPASWRVKEVDGPTWAKLCDDLRTEYDSFQRGVAQFVDWKNPMFARGVWAQVPHAAYHLGAIRQLVRVVKAGESARGVE